MNDKLDAPGSYVRQVHESTQQYAKDLLVEHEKVISLAAILRQEKARLEGEVQALRDQLGRHRELHWSLLEQVSQMEASNREFVARYVGVEHQNSNLANLYVASYRIHGSLDRTQVLGTIEDIVINLIGSEEFAVLERTEGPGLRVATSFGVDDERLDAICAGNEVVEQAISRGVSYLAPEGGARADATGVTACIPMKVDEQVVGAIVVIRLLSHKPGLEDLDHELFGLLATHAATALYCCDLHARTASEVRA